MTGKRVGDEKPLHWIGSSKGDLMEFPEEVKDNIGHALGLAQLGGKYPKAKPWKGDGPGVYEIVDDFDGETYRAAYTVRFEKAVYMLHAFQKKSPSGIKTPQRDIDVISQRLKTAKRHYEEHYGETSKAPRGRGAPRKR